MIQDVCPFIFIRTGAHDPVTSIGLRYWDGEQHLEQALELLVGHRDGNVALAAPSHLRLEVINALWSKSIDAERLANVARDLDDLDVLWFEIDHDLTGHAAHIAGETQLTVYDAAYAALALRLDAPLVTCDAKIIAANACTTRVLGPPESSSARDAL